MQKGTDSLASKRYKKIGLLGKGGYGSVYKASDSQANGDIVAIKKVKLDVTP